MLNIFFVRFLSVSTIIVLLTAALNNSVVLADDNHVLMFSNYGVQLLLGRFFLGLFSLQNKNRFWITIRISMEWPIFRSNGGS